MDSIVTFSRNSPHFLMDEKYSSFFFAMCAFSVGRNGSFVATALMPIQYNKLKQKLSAQKQKHIFRFPVDPISVCIIPNAL